uniref:Uncharacterized protein n=1 Tax=Porphyridium purpureum TaxID=35688 RepID=W0RZD8_PORPP|nr:hypothetical protein Y721_p048 [Porphyridium purpureum]BAO23760.1 hypothetical protein [Porphyridium purpureum]
MRQNKIVLIKQSYFFYIYFLYIYKFISVRYYFLQSLKSYKNSSMLECKVLSYYCITVYFSSY